MRLAVDVAERRSSRPTLAAEPGPRAQRARGRAAQGLRARPADRGLQPGRPAADRGRPGRARGPGRHAAAPGADRRPARAARRRRRAHRRRRRRRDARLPARAAPRGHARDVAMPDSGATAARGLRAAAAARRPVPPQRPRRRGHRPRHRVDWARRPRWGRSACIGDPRARAAAGRGGGLPRRPHAADAARRAARHPPRRRGRGHRPQPARCPSADACSAAWSTASACPSTAASRWRAAAATSSAGASSSPSRPRRCCARRSRSAWPSACARSTRVIPCGKGQRLGIFAGSGVGKSTLLGMIARNTEADVNVIALVGERGREVREFIERDLGPEGMARSVVRASPPPTSPPCCAPSAPRRP